MITMMLSVLALIVQPLAGERWWGGATITGRFQPYSDFDEHDQSQDSFCNQTAPFFVSSAGRYVWCEKPLKWSAKGGVMRFEGEAEPKLVVAGATLKEALLAAAKAHFPPSGKLPDEMFFTRPQYNHGVESYYTGMNQASVERYVQEIATNDFPMGVVMIDDGWEKDYGNWAFRPFEFPDPKGMCERLHAAGAKVMLWVVPYVSPDSLEMDALRKAGYLVRRNERGHVGLIGWWSGSSCSYDFSNPAARNHFEGKLRKLMTDYGIDGFKFDGADINHYAINAVTKIKYSRDGYAATDLCHDWSEIAAGFGFNELRASYNAAGLPLVQRLQDKAHSWEDLGALIPDMLAAGTLGYAYTCADMIGGGLIGSFLDPKFFFDRKIFIRSCQAQALMPMMQFSRAPWNVLNADDTAICRAAAKLHVEFAPYILELAREASKAGAPIVRPMEYEFPHQGLAEVKDQFMLGSKWLVAPVLKSDDSRTVRLPKGTWRDDLGETHVGPKTLELANVPLSRLPRYELVKAAAPVGLSLNTTRVRFLNLEDDGETLRMKGM